jgi:hypothetical protein
MVNYDKWDKLEISDDEEDTASRRATVTRLDAPSRVTFGGGLGKNVIEVSSAGRGAANETADVVTPGAAAAAATKGAPPGPSSSSHGTDYARFDAIARDLSDDDDDEKREYYEDEAWEAVHGNKTRGASAAETKSPHAREKRASPPVSSTALIRDARTKAFSSNGGVEFSAPGADASVGVDVSKTSSQTANAADFDAIKTMWSQTKEEVTLSVVVPPGTRASDVAVRCASDRVEVALKNRETGNYLRFLSDEWTHPIDPEPNDDDDDDDDAKNDARVFGDWEVCDWDPIGGSRVVRVTARKKRFGGSLKHWWRCGTKNGTPIDVKDIASRSKAAAETAERTRRVWEEATEAFKKKVRERERITIDAS